MKKKINRAATHIYLFGDKAQDRYLLARTGPGGYRTTQDDRPCGDWENHDQYRRYKVHGGVDMTARMIGELGCGTLHQAQPTRPSGEALDKPLYSMAEIAHCSRDEETGRFEFQAIGTDVGDKALRLRVSRFLGYWAGVPERLNYEFDEETIPHPDIIVINDAGRELRNSRKSRSNAFFTTMTALAGKAGRRKPAREVVMKMHLPLAEGLAWKLFAKASLARRRTLVVQAEDLRTAGIKISRCPSWDQVVDDIKTAMGPKAPKATGPVNLMALCGAADCVIVLFEVEGAVLIERENQEHRFTIVHDPAACEGQSAQDMPGDMVGNMNRFLAHLVHGLVVLPEEDSAGDSAMARRVHDAILAARVHANGMFTLKRETELRDPKVKSTGKQKPYAITRTDGPMPTNLITMGKPSAGDLHDYLREMAEKIVLRGRDKVMGEQPHGRFGKLMAVDRNEIEAMRSLDQLIRAYLQDQTNSKPLSLAVFGPPGAGKSFGVKQLVDSNETPVLEFNMSQADASHLPAIFHEIRDLNLKGKTPLCFFDEFDSQELKLLKYFLAPMQDGKFLEGDAVRPVGRGIFVFAGGTSFTMRDFASRGKEEKAAMAKLPDFVSRLSNFLDVKGPNPIADTSGWKTNSEDKPDFQVRKRSDPTYILRRAILVRAFISEYASSIINNTDETASIEPALVSRLLDVNDYRHGARSLEMLIQATAMRPSIRRLGLSDMPVEAIVAQFVED